MEPEMMTDKELKAALSLAVERLADRQQDIERLTAEVTGLRGLARAVASETSIPMEEIEQSIAAASGSQEST